MENRNEFRNHLETIPRPLCKNSFIALVPLLYVFLTAKGKAIARPYHRILARA